ncbi:hypothetical protein [Aquimarina agarivorans]|uniref:hypothetical protein n=1 Tax=Aquimarina agarivorans TaxID=980584 RepID=UPI000248EC31|nr:hypothetical protein [Aquimarina agarivorans]
MVKILLFFSIVVLFLYKMLAQIDANSLMGIPMATTAERLAITGITEGNMVYDTDINRLFEYTDTGWLEILTSNNTYLGVFQITGATPAQITVPGIPFAPTSVSFVAHPNIEVLDINADNSVGNNDNTSNNSFGTMNGFARGSGKTIDQQQVIYLGANGNSINDISRFASSDHAIGIRYGNQNGNNLGVITGEVIEFTSDGFIIEVTYANGSQNVGNEDLVVLFTAYR